MIQMSALLTPWHGCENYLDCAGCKEQGGGAGVLHGEGGFEKKTDYTNGGYRYVTVGPKRQDLELALWQEGSPDPTGSSSQLKPGIYPPIVMRVDDVRKISAELKARGVRFK